MHIKNCRFNIKELHFEVYKLLSESSKIILIKYLTLCFLHAIIWVQRTRGKQTMRGITSTKPLSVHVPKEVDPEIQAERNQEIILRNDLIQMTTNENSQREIRILNYCFSKVKPGSKDLPVVKTDMTTLCKVLGFGVSSIAFRDTEAALENLCRTGYSFKSANSDKVIKSSPWLKGFTIDKKKTIEITMNPVLAHYLIIDPQEGHYTKYKLDDIVKIRGRYAILLFQLLKSFENLGGVEADPEELKEYYGKVDHWSVFRASYLLPSIQKINDANVFEGKRVEMSTKLRNKYVVSVQIKLIEEELPRVPLFNWLED